MMKQRSVFAPHMVEGLAHVGHDELHRLPCVYGESHEQCETTVEESYTHILGFKLGALKGSKVLAKAT